MKIKLIESHYNEDDGFSYAKINTDYGEFVGFAQLHKEDSEIASRYAGCQYAERRAVLKYMKHRIKILAWQIQALNNCQNQFMGRALYNRNSVESRALRKQIFILQKEKKDWQSRYNEMANKLLKDMNERKTIVESFNKEDKECQK